jgi:hypothetical protein
VKERPVFCTAAEVRGILDGSVTQLVRKPLEPQPSWVESEYTGGHWYLEGYETRRGRRERVCGGPFDPVAYAKSEPGSWFAGSGCPYGRVGDRLWVRETWAEGDIRYATSPLLYRADGDAQPVKDDRWLSPVAMPRWAARLVLDITGVAARFIDGRWIWVLGVSRRPEPTWEEIERGIEQVIAENEGTMLDGG